MIDGPLKVEGGGKLMYRKSFIKVCGVVVALFILSGCVIDDTGTTVESWNPLIETVVSCDISIEAIQRATEAMNIISTGSELTFAIKQDGSLWAWEPRLSTQLNDVVAVSTKTRHAMALKSDGSLWIWGNNRYGQLGNGTTENIYYPIKIMEDVIYISAGTWHSVAIKSDGSLWGWGIWVGGSGFRPTPIQIMENVSAVSAEERLIIRTDGSLWRANTWWTEFVHIMDDVVAISSGFMYSMAIRTDGSLWAWGDNGAGQLGDGTTEDRDIPVKIMDDVVAVSAGMDFTMAIRSDGSLWAWGSNHFGQFGNGTNEDSLIPTKVMEDVIAVSTGGISFEMSFISPPIHTIALKSDGTLWAWGETVNTGWGDETLPWHERSVIPLPPVQIAEGIRVP